MSLPRQLLAHLAAHAPAARYLLACCLLTACAAEEDGPSECAPERLRCGGACVDPLSSQEHCGASGDCQGASAGRVCLADERCAAGRCVVPGLSALGLSAGRLTPSFAPELRSYRATVPSGVESVTVTAVPSVTGSALQLGAAALVAGAPSPPQPVPPGDSTLTITVTPPGDAPITYQVTLSRAEPVFDYLKSSAPRESDFLGASVALSGDLLAVGAPDEDALGQDSGAVYLYRKGPGGWRQEARLVASGGEARDDFGAAVAVSGDVVAVGAPAEDSRATGVNGDEKDNGADRSGAVYVFRRSAGVWAQEAYLKASNTDAGDRFGSALSLDGERLAVGAYAEASNATGVGADQSGNGAPGRGAVYVFRHGLSTWAQEAYLKPSNRPFFFGWALSLGGELLAVGAPGDSSPATGVGGDQLGTTAALSGAVYVFKRSGLSWSQEAYLKASNTEAGDQFGSSVALSGDALLCGAPEEDSAATGPNGVQGDNGASNSGAAYLFRRSAGIWAQEAYLKASNTGAEDRFGSSVALSGDQLAIGAPEEDSAATGLNGAQDSNGASNSGAAYLFSRGGGTWRPGGYLKASNGAALDRFGHQLTLSNGTLAVGAPSEGGAAPGINGDQGARGLVNAGAVYVLRRPLPLP